MVNKPEAYRWVKIGGIGVSIPFILISGPLVFAVTAGYLKDRFHIPQWSVLLIVLLGFAGSIMETIKVIKFLLRLLKD